MTGRVTDLTNGPVATTPQTRCMTPVVKYAAKSEWLCTGARVDGRNFESAAQLPLMRPIATTRLERKD